MTKILFAAGGTGGHIFPALAIEKALREIEPHIEAKFVCGSRPVELDLYRRAQIEPFVLNVQHLRSGIISKTTGATKLALAFLKALIFLKRWKPDLIIGQGGYITAPVLLAARLLGIPYDLQEQNSVPGRTNRWFAKKADTVFCSFESAVSRFTNHSKKVNCRVTGLPLRREVLEGDAERARKRFGLDSSLPVLLAIGGSQGARRLYELLLEALYLLDDKNSCCPPFQCLWSSGKRNLGWIKTKLELHPLEKIRAIPLEFIAAMGDAYAAATVAISRAGAGSVAELMANRIPTIFVPLPHAVRDHQRLNALSAVNAGAAVLLNEKELTPARLADDISDLFISADKRASMARSARSVCSPDAARHIANYVLADWQERNSLRQSSK